MGDSILFRQLFDYETWTYTYLLYDPENPDIKKEFPGLTVIKDRQETPVLEF